MSIAEVQIVRAARLENKRFSLACSTSKSPQANRGREWVSPIIGDTDGQVCMDQRHRPGRGHRAIGAQGRDRHPDALRTEWAAVGGGGGISGVEAGACRGHGGDIWLPL